MSEHERDFGNTLPVATAAMRGLGRPTGQTALLVHGPEGVRVAPLAEGQRLVVGRDPSAGLFIDDASLSRRHARFSREGADVWVEDLGSTNGTLLGRERLSSRTRLLPGAEVQLGQVFVGLHAASDKKSAVSGAALEPHDQFLRELDRELARARSCGRGFALLLFASAAAGRLESDAPLCWLRQHLRPWDRVAAYGPGLAEVLLPEVDVHTAATIAERLLRRPDAAFERCGVAPHPRAGTSAEALIEAAREALRGTTAAARLVVAETAGEREQAADVVASPAEPVVRSAAMRELQATISRLAGTVVPVLVLGETGVGKEVLARAIHQVDGRRAHRLVSINCGAIPSTLLESVLFGHERGAFTGATEPRRGLFEQADGGTLFLDEIGELALSAQAALLRVLETRCVTRVGGRDEREVDVRVVAATHRDLEAMVDSQAFRRDLLFRINTIALPVPPLRERLEEIGALTEQFLAAANAANGCSVPGVDAATLRQLHRYLWPGNVRELRNVVERAVIIARDREIALDDLPERVRSGAGPKLPEEATAVAPPADVDILPRDLREHLRETELRLILAALAQADGQRAEAARLLGLPLRTLSHKIRQLGIKRAYGEAGDKSD